MPTTVTLTAPELAVLAMATLLGAAASIVNANVNVASCHPTVSSTSSPLDTPLTVRATRVLSDSQSVASETLAPALVVPL